MLTVAKRRDEVLNECRAAHKIGVAIFFALIAHLMMMPSPGLAERVERPVNGVAVLSIELPGNKIHHFSINDLEKLAVSSFATTTPWTKDKSKFEGVYLKHVLAAVGAKGSQIKAVALNDYASQLPFTDADTKNVLIAFKVDGKQLVIRDKGPLWLVYPFDQDPSLKQEVIYARSVWQLRKLVIVE